MRTRPTARRLAAFCVAILFVGLVLLIPFEPAYAAGPSLTGYTGIPTPTNPTVTTTSLSVTAGDVLVGLVTTYSTVGLGTMSVKDGASNALTLAASHSVANCAGGQTVVAYIFDEVAPSTVSTALTATDITVNGNIYLMFADISNAVVTGQVTATGDGSTSPTATGSASFSFGSWMELSSMTWDWCTSLPTVTAGASYTVMNTPADRYGFEYSTAAASPTTFPFTFTGGSNYEWSEVGLVLGPVGGTTTTRSPSTAISLSVGLIKSVTLLASRSVSLTPNVQKSDTLNAVTSVSLSPSITSLCSVTCHSVARNQQFFAILLVLAILAGFAMIGYKVSKR